MIKYCYYIVLTLVVGVVGGIDKRHLVTRKNRKIRAGNRVKKENAIGVTRSMNFFFAHAPNKNTSVIHSFHSRTDVDIFGSLFRKIEK